MSTARPSEGARAAAAGRRCGGRPRDAALRAATAAVAALGLALALAACQHGEALAATPGGQALIASQPAMSTAHVPRPPAIAGVVVGTPAASASGAATDELASVNAQLDATLDKASACTADAQCRAVGTGGRACGGPTAYRAYSTSSIDASGVEALAQRQRDLATEAARASHRVSPCFMLANPGARCVQNKCVTGRAGTN